MPLPDIDQCWITLEPLADRKLRTVPRPGKPRNRQRKRIRRLLYLRDGLDCVYCGLVMTYDGRVENRPTIDHVTPRHLGGTNDLENLVLCCLPCNDEKAGRTVEELSKVWQERIAAHLRRIRDE